MLSHIWPSLSRGGSKNFSNFSNSNSGEFAELRGGDNEVRLWVVPHVARDKVRGSRKRGAEEHLVIGIGECLARICGHDFFAEQLYV